MTEMVSLIDKTFLDNLGKSLIITATSHKFIEELKQIQKAPSTKRLQESIELAKIETLENKGIPTAAGFRITTRNFEEPFNTDQINLNNIENIEPVVMFEDGYGSILYNGEVINVMPVRKKRKDFNKTNEEIGRLILDGISQISRFILKTNFQSLLMELYSLNNYIEKQEYVLNVLLNKKELEKKQIKIPKSLKIQRSYFFDGRQTLFCVSKVIPKAYPWHKVTITFDCN